MVGKTYLRYDYATACPVIVSSASTNMGIMNLPVRTAGGVTSAVSTATSSQGRGYGRGGRTVVSTMTANRPNQNNTATDAQQSDVVAAVPALENINFWNLKTGNLLGTIAPAACAMANTTSTTVLEGTARVRTATNEVTSLNLIEVEKGTVWHMVVGYASGYVAFFRGSYLTHDSALATASKSPINWVCDVFALGHKPDTNVLSLALQSVSNTNAAAIGASSMDHLLCSGGQDTDISVWDLTAQEPLYRLRGHRGGVVALAFVSNHATYGSDNNNTTAALSSSTNTAFSAGLMGRSLLVSGGADGLVKAWDLAVQQCIQTIVATDTQVTSFRYFPGQMGVGGCGLNGGRLVVGLRENVLKVYALNESGTTLTAAAAPSASSAAAAAATGAGGVISATSNADVRIFNEHGAVARKTHKAVTTITLSPDGKYICLQSADTLELFAVVSEEEIKRRLTQRRKRQQRNKKEKRAREGGNVDEDVDEDEEDDTMAGTGLFVDAAKDELTHLRTYNFAQVHNATNVEAADEKKDQRRIRSVSFCSLPANNNGKHQMHLCVVYNNNSIETFLCAEKEAEVSTGATAAKTLSDLKSNHVVAHSGHRFDVKHMEFADKDESIVSMSKDSVKLWNLSYASSANSWQQSTLGFGVSSANRERVLDEAYYNNVAPPPEQQLVCTGSVNPSAISDSPSAFTCCAVIASDLVAVGDEKGGLHLLNLKSGDVVCSDASAHIGAIKSISKLPADNGFSTVGSDRRIITWHLALIKKSSVQKIDTKKAPKNAEDDGASNKAGAPVITLQIAHEMELTETPLFVKYAKLAPNHKKVHKSHNEDGAEVMTSNELYAVGLQDNNIQLFYADSNKRFLVLYGHKLAATDVDFSDDGQLIASVGIDKALRFWGSDFGDCHRAIHAHDDYVTRVTFVPGTHYVFTASLDGSVKHWDGDTWTMIQQFRSHQRGLYALALNSNGSHFASAGSDKCLRVFARSEEMLFPEEEASRIAQEAMDDEAARRNAIQKLDEKDVEVGVSGQATAATNTSAEKLMDALDLVSIELQRLGDGGKVQMTAAASLIFRNRSVWEYLWATIEEIRPSELRHCIAALTSIHLSALLQYLSLMDSHGAILNYETAAKVLLALVAPAPGSSARPVMFFSEENSIEMKTSSDSAAITNIERLESLRNRIAARLQQQTDRMEGNIASLKFIMARLTDKERVKFYDVSKIQGHKKKYHTSAIL